jgi:hypothetical protein
MSLVVARKYGKQILIVSDTRLSDAHGKKTSPTQGIIKSIIIDSNLCVSFAGIIDYADNALKSFRKMGINTDSFTRTVEHFFDWHIRSRKETDFVIAFGKPHYKIAEIKDGQCVEAVNSWIGDAKAFARFQGYFHNVLAAVPTPIDTANISLVYVPEPEEEGASDAYSQMLKAIMAVNTDTDMQYVGDFAVPVAYHKGGFQYMDYVYVLTNPINWDVMPEEFVLPFGTTEEGGYGFNFIGALDGNLPAMYFLQGSLGILFTPKDGGLLQPIVIRSVGPIEFQEQVQADFGIEVRSMFVGADTYGSRGRRRFEATDYEGALADYNKSIEMDPNDPRSFRGRAMVYQAVGDIQKIIADLTKAIELDPHDAPTYHRRGLIYGQMGNLDQAISDCSIAIDQNPAYALAYRTRAIALNLKGDIASANRDLEKFSKLNSYGKA